MLRENSDLVLRLFQMMIPASLPELRKNSDIEYLREMLRLDMTNAEAKSYMRAELESCLVGMKHMVKAADNTLHILKHKKKGGGGKMDKVR